MEIRFEPLPAVTEKENWSLLTGFDRQKHVFRRFAREIQKHEMRVLLDIETPQGPYTHLRFRVPEDSALWFDLIRVPDSCMIRGDMGTYVFDRPNTDMFLFFSSGANDDPMSFVSINPSYWLQKCIAIGKPEHALEWCPGLAQDYIESEREQLAEAGELTPDLENELDRLCAESLDSNIHSFRESLEEVLEPDEGPDLEDYTYHYLWCLYAIVWGVKRYNLSKTP